MGIGKCSLHDPGTLLIHIRKNLGVIRECSRLIATHVECGRIDLPYPDERHNRLCLHFRFLFDPLNAFPYALYGVTEGLHCFIATLICFVFDLLEAALIEAKPVNGEYNGKQTNGNCCERVGGCHPHDIELGPL